MPSGKNNKSVRKARSVVNATKPKPWGTIAAVMAIVLFAGGVFGFLFLRYENQQAADQALSPFTPSAENPDPSQQIEGVTTVEYEAGQHVVDPERVAYDQSPPFGGPHDAYWANCDGTVYDDPVRSENMVHGLEHGAVWIAYDAERVTGPALDTLRAKVEGQQYMMMSPYPGLDSPISLQSWGHQLKLDSADDPRIDQFVRALRLNPNGVYPEVGATCSTQAGGPFDVRNPPPFDATPPGPDARPMSGQGSTPAPEENTGMGG